VEAGEKAVLREEAKKLQEHYHSAKGNAAQDEQMVDRVAQE
jgi:hypothetical protein